VTIHPRTITAEQLRAARALLGLTQEELSQKAGLSKTALNNFERGAVTPRPETLNQLRDALERSGIEFMGQTGVNLAGDPFKAQILEGDAAFKLIFEDVFETLKGTGRNLLVSGLDENRFLDQDKEYFLGVIERQLQNGIGSKLLICEGDTNLVEPLEHYRWVPKRIFHQVPYFIYANKYAIILWGTPLRVVLIENVSIANSFRKQFNENWSKGKMPELPQGSKVHFHQYKSLLESDQRT